MTHDIDDKVTLGTLFYEAKANSWRDDGMHQNPTLEELAEQQRIPAEWAAKEEAEIACERTAPALRAATLARMSARGANAWEGENRSPTHQRDD